MDKTSKSTITCKSVKTSALALGVIGTLCLLVSVMSGIMMAIETDRLTRENPDMTPKQVINTPSVQVSNSIAVSSAFAMAFSYIMWMVMVFIYKAGFKCN